MGSFTVTHTTPASPDAVWEILDDFANVSAWSSGVATSALTNDIEQGVGAERLCTFDNAGKQWVKERVLERGDDHVVIDIFETNAPMNFLRATIKVTPAGSGSQIDMTTTMIVKGGPLGKLMEVAMVKPNFKKAVKRLLADLDKTASALVAA